jgi:hypothetical protein
MSFDIESKFMRVFLILIGAVFVFAGPTYLPLILNEVLQIGYAVSMSVGFIVFLIGIFDFLYLARKKVIT